MKQYARVDSTGRVIALERVAGKKAPSDRWNLVEIDDAKLLEQLRLGERAVYFDRDDKGSWQRTPRQAPILRIDVDRPTIRADGDDSALVTITGVPAGETIEVMVGGELVQFEAGDVIRVDSDQPAQIEVELLPDCPYWCNRKRVSIRAVDPAVLERSSRVSALVERRRTSDAVREARARQGEQRGDAPAGTTPAE